MATGGARRSGMVWAVIGGGVLVAATVAIIVSVSLSSGGVPTPTGPSGDSDPSSSVPSVIPSAGAVVDASVLERGWVPEPVTTEAETYVRAALAAASTFDTQKAPREDWIRFLGTWFTPDTRYTSDTDRQADMEAAKLELRQGVVLPEEEWDSLAAEKGRVVAVVTGEVVLFPVPEDASGDQRFGTADVTLTYARSDSSGTESSYDEQVRVSVQVLCGEGSVPVPGSTQQAGDCKVVRFFTAPLEP